MQHCKKWNVDPRRGGAVRRAAKSLRLDANGFVRQRASLLSLRLMLASMLAALLIVAPSKSAPSQQQQQYDKAKAAYDEVQYGEAIGILDGLLALADLSDPLRRQATLLIGFCQVGLGNGEAAEKRFREVLAIELDQKLPGGTSPKIKDAFEKVRAKVLREKVAEAEKQKELDTQKPTTIDQPRVVEKAKSDVAPPPQTTVAVEPATPVYKKWWFWTIIVGVAAAGAAAAVTAVVLTERAQPRPGQVDVEIGFAR